MALTSALLLSLAAAPGPLADPLEQIPDLQVDLRYATADNFLKRSVYPKHARCFLLPQAVEQLKKAAEALREKGFRLKVYDCYRPRAVQWEMWKLVPKPGYVADPRQGSNHNRGAAVDLTLVTLDGTELEMPTAYDFFGKAAHHGSPASEAAVRHRELLLKTMEAAGFKRNRMEWWHYDLPRAGRFKVLDLPFPE
jgi:D-alanyl-D-alanine dipeptidase